MTWISIVPFVAVFVIGIITELTVKDRRLGAGLSSNPWLKSGISLGVVITTILALTVFFVSSMRLKWLPPPNWWMTILTAAVAAAGLVMGYAIRRTRVR